MPSTKTQATIKRIEYFEVQKNCHMILAQFFLFQNLPTNETKYTF